MGILLPDSWNAGNFTITRAVEDNLDDLERIGKSWTQKKTVEGYPFPRHYFEDCLYDGNLPPIDEPDSELYKLMVIRNSDTGAVNGFFDMYHGYPDEFTLWISNFVIDQALWENGIGTNVTASIIERAKECEWEFLAHSVSLKNWRGLKFLVGIGFDRAIGVFGDTDFGEDSSAIIGMRRLLQ